MKKKSFVTLKKMRDLFVLTQIEQIQFLFWEINIYNIWKIYYWDLKG